jgi:hypothetical protein
MKEDVRASFQQSGVRSHHPDIRSICRCFVEKHFRIVRAPMVPGRCRVGRIKFYIRIQRDRNVHERLGEGFDEICVVKWWVVVD